ncbi:SDR family oxidoreductase [Ferrovibrio terrae]|uniref:SDR family oxidoreductase n=1 Tax=Ferrovibrio terrae TaxID=2594003 RepID=UPI0031380156
MDLGLTGKRALVLGSSRGLGAAVARTLAREGATVIAAARSVQDTKAWIAAEAPDVAVRLSAHALDLSDRASVDALADAVLAQAGVDILVNNSGGPPPGAAAEIALELWQTQFAAMAGHLFHLSGRLLPPMLARGWGRIITIASSGIEQPIPNLALSNGLRMAVLGWSKTLAAEVAPKGVTVNLVLPGRIHTDRVDQLDQAAASKQGKSRDDVAKASQAAIPMGRYGRPEEFADAVAFLASERAGYITGTKLRVDGGMIRGV